jgi:polyhydroxybutyrate depolymerase
MPILSRVPAPVPAIFVRLAAATGCVLVLVGVLFADHAGVRASASAGEASGSLTFGGLQRTYLVHAPAGGGHPAGLVINLHGAGGSGAAQAATTHYDTVADQLGLVVVYPDGIDQSWADGRGASKPDRQGVDDVGFLSALADRLVHDYGIDPGRVFATGMSAGAFMTNRLACDRADLIAAIAPVSGTLGAGVGCAPSRPVAVLETHGTADPVVPYDGGTMHGRGGVSDILPATAMASRWRDADGCPAPVQDALPNTGDGTSVRRLTAAGCADGTAVVLLTVDGGGHTWPRGNFALPADAVGLATGATDISLASGQFFLLHAR